MQVEWAQTQLCPARGGSGLKAQTTYRNFTEQLYIFLVSDKNQFCRQLDGHGFQPPFTLQWEYPLSNRQQQFLWPSECGSETMQCHSKFRMLLFPFNAVQCRSKTVQKTGHLFKFRSISVQCRSKVLWTYVQAP